jgi:glycine dehydrogenase subunit 1
VFKVDFIPHDEKTILEMLEVIGLKSINELFQDIPKDLILKKLNLPSGIPEYDVFYRLKSLSEKSKLYTTSFLGAGCYYHYIPSLVDFVISRSEFYTSYTPYQAEASQGFLQAIYEYQTIIAHLTQMDVVNASMYDGSTALAEAALMATIITHKNKILILKGLHPEYIQVVKTYCWGQEIDCDIIHLEDIEHKLNEEYAALIIQSPNFFGEIEDIQDIVKKVRGKVPKCLIIQIMTDPTCLGIIKPPGELDIDIFVAEGQAFGISPSFGGPSLGIFASKKEFLRKIPGRLVGKTTEINGENIGFILTLQAREQHIRREKASSNICTNQALCSLAALIYLLSLGKTGLKNIALQNIQKTHFVKNQLAKIAGYKIVNKKPTYNEFIVECPNVEILLQKCDELNLLPPLKLSRYYPHMKNLVLVCVTEMNSSTSIEKFLQAAKLSSKNKEGRKL